MLTSILDRITAAIKEPSSHAGIATVCLALSFVLPAYAPILTKIAVVFGGASVVMPEKK